MPPREIFAYILDIKEAAHAIDMTVVGLSFDTHDSIRELRGAVEREFMIIGEAMRQCSKSRRNLKQESLLSAKSSPSAINSRMAIS